eukprot:CAMPEP_0181346610 /NCGR_PEP_ID=MMETSP1101-20121128/33419_1 /TAXON_ID=46948 /ORGANISM="Rhodomonas abbreviata, Strain Caron Lab Isolate" /LENGTH=142 /DNA_ID=CAMNT_0023458733 /DNA_START=364 /DNA_END=789 /DNA_ORIENTATION=+
MLHHHALRMLLEPGGQIAEVVLAIAGHRLEQHPLLCEHPEAQRPARQRRVEGVGNRIGVEAGAERLGHLAVGAAASLSSSVVCCLKERGASLMGHSSSACASSRYTPRKRTRGVHCATRALMAGSSARNGGQEYDAANTTVA